MSTSRGGEIECDLVILSIGIKPESHLARASNLEIGQRGGIKVNASMQTSDPDIFAVGDAVEIKEFVTGVPAIIALAGPTNKQGRIAADNGKLLGAQVVCKEGVDKRIDVLATALRGNMTVFDLEELELAYAPPYSSVKDPVNIAGFMAANILKGDVENTYWQDLEALDGNECFLVDLRTKKKLEKIGTIDDAINIPVDDLRHNIEKLDKEKAYVLCCTVGQRAYIGHRILKQKGFQSSNLSGGYVTYSSVKEKIKSGN